MSSILNRSIAPNGQPPPIARARSSSIPQDVSRNLPQAQPLHGNPLVGSMKINHSSGAVATGASPPWLHEGAKDDSRDNIFHNSTSCGDGGSSSSSSSSTDACQNLVESNNSGTAVEGIEEFSPWSASNFLQSVLGGNKLNSIEDVGDRDGFSLEKHLTLAVTVSSAVKLEKKQIDQITRKMKKLTGFSSLHLKNIIDPSLIAGFIIRYGSGESHVIDLSVKSKLAELVARIENTEQRRAELERRFP